MTLSGTLSVVWPLLTLVPPSGLLGVFFARAVGYSRQLEVMTPKWVAMGVPLGPGYPPTWAISNAGIAEKLESVPLVTVNRTSHPVTLTLMLLEWFVPTIVPKRFCREFGLRRMIVNSPIYRRKMVDLPKVEVVGANDSAVFTLRWTDAEEFYAELLKSGLMDPYGHVGVLITFYDEYADRFFSSREIPLQSIVARRRALDTFKAFGKERKTASKT